MQKIKSEKGITLVILVVTMVIMLILVGVSMDIGFDAADSAEDSKYLAEVQMVAQACISEYTRAMQLGYLKDDGSIPANFIGTRITWEDTDVLPTLQMGEWALGRVQAVGYKSYFRLDKESLALLGIENTDDSYIINYYTGEAYNETKKKTDGGDMLYIMLNTAIEAEPDTDTTSFT